MIEGILEFFFGTLVDFVVEGACALFGGFGGKRGSSKDGKDKEKTDDSGQE